MKKAFILFFLISAYALVIGHNIVPHHHHDETEQADHDHNHHNEHHDINDCEQHEGLPEFFSNFVHDSHTISTGPTIDEQFVKIIKVEFHFISFVDSQFDYSQVVFNSDHPPGRKILASSLFVFDARSLRAPPVC